LESKDKRQIPATEGGFLGMGAHPNPAHYKPKSESRWRKTKKIKALTDAGYGQPKEEKAGKRGELGRSAERLLMRRTGSKTNRTDHELGGPSGPGRRNWGDLDSMLQRSTASILEAGGQS